MKFSLQPFPSDEPVPKIEIIGKIDRHENQLDLCYQLLGNLQDLLIATTSDLPTRQDELWRETCFEFFLGIKNTSPYWEFNLSPSGNWNVYSFEKYRLGMTSELAFTDLPFKIDRQSHQFTLSLEVNLETIGLTESTLEVGITAVIKQSDQRVTYWALTHPGSQADFHLRESFILKI
jgi:hypothetical protein